MTDIVEVASGEIQIIEVASGSVEIIEVAIQGPPGINGPTDHGALTGLSDDDHVLYHTDARGDARYSPLAHAHAGIYEPANAPSAYQQHGQPAQCHGGAIRGRCDGNSSRLDRHS